MQRDVSHSSHYNEGHLHICLGPGIPQPPASRPALRQVYCQAYGQQISANQHVVSRPILGGRYYEYGLEKTAA